MIFNNVSRASTSDLRFQSFEYALICLNFFKIAKPVTTMGCSASCQSAEAAAAANRTRDIDLKLETSRKIAQKQPKILLLGSGGGGKSTIAKQLRIIHGTGYTKNDRIMYRPVIFSNCLQSLLEVIGVMEKLGALFYEPCRMNDVATLMGLAKNFKEEYITREVGELMLRLWRDVGVQNAFSGSAKYQLNDSASYFLKSLKRIFNKQYIPSEQDILQARTRTTGIIETHFNFKGLEFRLVDVGGQKSQRKKWLHCFEDVTAILFCASLAAYDQALEEDESINRMVESIELYKYVCHIRWFLKKRIILFLNKKDLLKEKLNQIPLQICFPEYKGPNTYDDAVAYIESRFLTNGRNKKETYIHITCATDTESITLVLSDVIVKLNQEECGMY